MIIKEEWRPVVGFEGLYEVSNTGLVRNIKGKLLKLWNCNGYLEVGLNKKGKTKKTYVHRLVAQVFIPNPDNLPQVNHKDEDKSNNRVDNLEWCDVKYNNNYGTRQERIRITNLRSGYWTGLSVKEYYEKNKEKKKEYKKEYSKKNKEKIKAKAKEYYEKNKEKKRAYYYRHREEILEKMKKVRK